jgi:hypothetical protein
MIFHHNQNISTDLLHIRITGKRGKKRLSITEDKTNISNVLKSATNQTFGIEDGVTGIHSGLILGSIANQTLLSRESDI